MARTTVRIERPVEEVYELLLRAECYPAWVVGAKKVRGTSGGWPAPGAAFHHVVGVGPLAVADRTRIVAMDPPRRLVLDARAWPIGRARVELALTPLGASATRLVMVEAVVSGPARLLPRPLRTPMIDVRNRVALRRLRRLVLLHQAG